MPSWRAWVSFQECLSQEVEAKMKAAAVRRSVRDFFMGICKAAILSPEVRRANGKSSQ
jgi:hypothetical protein